MEDLAVSDSSVNLTDLKKLIGDFNKERGWLNMHNPKNVSMSLVVEAAELMKHFQWMSEDEIEEVHCDQKKLEQIRDELADVIIYCICFANNMGIDITESVIRKIDKNAAKFPKPVYVPVNMG